MLNLVRKLFHKRTALQAAVETAATVDMQREKREISAHSMQDDSAIRSPEQDSFGIDPFARAIAASIREANPKNGLVYAINGPWGSGKSSAVNLVLHHLEDATARGEIIVSAFNPWWFSGSEALTLSFFQELHAIVGKSVDEKARRALASLGGRLSSAGPLLGGIASLFASPAAGAAVTGGASLLEKLTHLEDTVESEHQAVVDALGAQSKRFLIVIDDIDRLATDDALQMFKLIKSVGRLPNVIYLTAFDRRLAEQMVAERFPAEGNSYLEKIIQGAFDLPTPNRDDLHNQLLATVDKVMGAPDDDKTQRFWNLFHDGVAPLLNTPRDALRLCNAVSVSWPAVGSDVDRADFLTIEAIRLFCPITYEAVRAHPEMLTGEAPQRGNGGSSPASEYDELYLNHIKNKRIREVVKRGLRRLFPRLNAVWGNVWHSGTKDWRRHRLICSPEHFATYFSFGVTNDMITKAESDSLVVQAGVPGATAAAMKTFLAMPRRRGGTRAALALDELSIRARDIAEIAYHQLLEDLFAIADEIDLKADAAQGFEIASNQLRLHWLLNNLLLEGTDLRSRSRLIRAAASKAALGWLVSLSDRCKRNNEKSGEEDELLVDDETSSWLYTNSLERLRAAASDGTLVQVPELPSMLLRWRDRAGESEVRKWTDSRLSDDIFVVSLARDLVRETWSHGMGGFGFLEDRVASRAEYVNLEPLAPLLDIGRLRERVAALLSSSEIDSATMQVLERFAKTPERDPLD